MPGQRPTDRILHLFKQGRLPSRSSLQSPTPPLPTIMHDLCNLYNLLSITMPFFDSMTLQSPDIQLLHFLQHAGSPETPCLRRHFLSSPLRTEKDVGTPSNTIYIIYIIQYYLFPYPDLGKCRDAGLDECLTCVMYLRITVCTTVCVYAIRN